MNRNRVLLIGYVGREVVTTQTPNGGKRAAILLATHYRHTNEKGEPADHTVWHNIVAWDASASFAERSFVKGSKILVEGAIDYRRFMGKEGQWVKITRIKAHALMNLDR